MSVGDWDDCVLLGFGETGGGGEILNDCGLFVGLEEIGSGGRFLGALFGSAYSASSCPVSMYGMGLGE